MSMKMFCINLPELILNKIIIFKSIFQIRYGILILAIKLLLPSFLRNSILYICQNLRFKYNLTEGLKKVFANNIAVEFEIQFWKLRVI